MEEKQKHKGRVFLLVGVIIAVFVVFALRLMKYQIVDAEKYREMAQGNYTSTQSIDAARGEMLDRYGRPLAVNQVSYDVMINEAYLPNKMRNTVIERIILLMESEEQSWIDTLPISTTEPFAFLTETESQKRQLEQIKTNNKKHAVILQKLSGIKYSFYNMVSFFRDRVILVIVAALVLLLIVLLVLNYRMNSRRKRRSRTRGRRSSGGMSLNSRRSFSAGKRKGRRRRGADYTSSRRTTGAKMSDSGSSISARKMKKNRKKTRESFGRSFYDFDK